MTSPFGSSSDSERNFEVIRDITGFPKLFESIQKRGYSDKEVKKIQGENFFRVFIEVIK